MSNISPRLPLSIDAANGYAQNHTEIEAIIQDLKMLILTSPGERTMDPNFGVGMRRFLFEQNNAPTHASIRARIRRQAAEYMPFLDITDISFSTDLDGEGFRANSLLVGITFYIPSLGVGSTANINV